MCHRMATWVIRCSLIAVGPVVWPGTYGSGRSRAPRTWGCAPNAVEPRTGERRLQRTNSLRILDRYVIREIVLPLLIGLVVLTFVLVIPPILQQGEALIS